MEGPGHAGGSDFGVAAGVFEGREVMAGMNRGGQEEEDRAEGLHLNFCAAQRLQARQRPVFWERMQATEFCKHL